MSDARGDLKVAATALEPPGAFQKTGHRPAAKLEPGLRRLAEDVGAGLTPAPKGAHGKRPYDRQRSPEGLSAALV